MEGQGEQGIRREFFRDSLPHLSINSLLFIVMGLPRWLSGKESTCQAGDAEDLGLIPGSGRSPREGYGNPLKYSWTEEPGRPQSMGSQRVGHD